MTLRLLNRQPSRTFAAPAPDPNACHCTIRHPRTAAERLQVETAIVLARWNGQTDLVTYLTEQLSTPCRTARPVCPCGCGRPPGQHNPQHAELRSAA